ncbi:MAG TPA: hypothetical protein VM242_13470 [Acidimicrobiales bacterium]|nr:hypothetical protein [Acidimicrobiales bacterium]
MGEPTRRPPITLVRRLELHSADIRHVPHLERRHRLVLPVTGPSLNGSGARSERWALQI